TAHAPAGHLGPDRGFSGHERGHGTGPRPREKHHSVWGMRPDANSLHTAAHVLEPGAERRGGARGAAPARRLPAAVHQGRQHQRLHEYVGGPAAAGGLGQRRGRVGGGWGHQNRGRRGQAGLRQGRRLPQAAAATAGQLRPRRAGQGRRRVGRGQRPRDGRVGPGQNGQPLAAKGRRCRGVRHRPPGRGGRGHSASRAARVERRHQCRQLAQGGRANALGKTGELTSALEKSAQVAKSGRVLTGAAEEVSDAARLSEEAIEQAAKKGEAVQLDSYGAVREGRGRAQDCPFRFQGQYEDVETGLYYNRARYYDPQTEVNGEKEVFGRIGPGNFSNYDQITDSPVFVDGMLVN
nr:hypothetical protein [Tanacetum cinerariifolium]